MSRNRSEDLRKICQGLRVKLKNAIKDLSFDGSLFSGGLDSSIINYIASEQGKDFECVSVGFEESAMKDLEYARIVANELNLKQHIHIFDFSEVKDATREVIRIMESFDPMEVRNSVSIYIAMKEAKELGMKIILTGDGSDELFAGYSFLYNLPLNELQSELEKVWKYMRFSSQTIAESLGIEAVSPYLHEEVKEFAMNIRPQLKVGEWKGRRIGKWILREAFEDKLPSDIIWREKTPIEEGTGTAVLPEKFDSIMESEDFESNKKRMGDNDNVDIRSKEQLYYYKIYRSIFGPPKPVDPKRRACPYCNVNVPEDASFCRTCGNTIEN